MNNDKYVIPALTRIGHVHLKVSDLDRAINFYSGILGFEVTMNYGDQAAFLSAGGYHHHIGLNTWHSKGAGPAPVNYPGLYHVAIVFPERKDLAVIFKRLLDVKYPLAGASDHGVSEAIYLNDPDGNGIELCWDKPREQWPSTPEGDMDMYTKALDLEDLLSEIEKE